MLRETIEFLTIKPCDVCDGKGAWAIPEMGHTEICWGCKGSGGTTLLDRIRIWNATHPRGSYPERLWCLFLRHDWQNIELIQYCTRCRAVWDIQWEEKQAPIR